MSTIFSKKNLDEREIFPFRSPKTYRSRTPPNMSEIKKDIHNLKLNEPPIETRDIIYLKTAPLEIGYKEGMKLNFLCHETTRSETDDDIWF
ncbi:hypothetical protein SNEBB_004005 [Seison nebaliae]|nr:hypothetical protein SNEBB_004005 [Seison nebaliae]